MSLDPVQVVILTQQPIPDDDAFWSSMGLSRVAPRVLEVLQPNPSTRTVRLSLEVKACTDVPISAEESEHHYEHDRELPPTAFLRSIFGLDEGDWSSIWLMEDTEVGLLHMEPCVWGLTRDLQGVAFMFNMDLGEGLHTDLLYDHRRAPLHERVFIWLASRLAPSHNSNMSDPLWRRFHDSIGPWLEQQLRDGIPGEPAPWLKRAQAHAASLGFHAAYEDPLDPDTFLQEFDKAAI